MGRRSRSICAVFPNARRFDPDRFLSRPPDPAEWIPYGGGIRRCIGAAFATMEMRVVLRTLLRNYVISPSSARDERWRSRGVAVAPSRGARVRIQPRRESATAIG
jgi:cytochrome P450 family 138